MFAIRKETTQLQETISSLQRVLDEVDLDASERTKLVDQLLMLHKLQNESSRGKVSAETWATIAANLAGILIIVKHEQANVIASKALAFVTKLR